MNTASFFRGVGAGAVAGAMLGAMVMSRQDAMKTGVGRTMQRMGNAMDAAWYDFKRAMK
ncbi:MAG: hypothetical protein J5449_11365 [Oscillospiraceae bacterium]|nr:hypothetical protein [Oscillospiraceae bacterium]